MLDTGRPPSPLPPTTAAEARRHLTKSRASQNTDPLFGPAPCDECRYAARCGAKRLACDAFFLYVDGASEVRWGMAPRVATVTRFTTIFRAQVSHG